MRRRDGTVGLVEIARLAGVSPATVSRALAGNPMVAEATRARVRELAREHGFRLNQTASALRKRRTGTVGVVVPLGHDRAQGLSDPFFMGLIAPLADALAEAGFDVLLSRVVPRNADWLGERVDGGRVDGVVVVGQSDQTRAIEQVARRYEPMVVWGARVADGAQVTVGTDNVAGGRMAAERLLAAGRTRIAFFGNPDAPEFAARHRGVRDALAAAGAEGALLPVHLTADDAHREIAASLRTDPPIDGVVAASDVIAMAALRALAERGLRVPDDVGVVGYDDVPLARFTTPPLTTVRQDLERGAKLLVDLLLRRMRGEAVEPVEMTPELIVRASG